MGIIKVNKNSKTNTSSIMPNTGLFLYFPDGNFVLRNAQAQGHPILYCSEFSRSRGSHKIAVIGIINVYKNK